MSDLNAFIDRFEAAMTRLEASADAFAARRRAEADADKLDRLTPPGAAEPPSSAAATDENPLVAALKTAQAELRRLRLENDALRAVGAAADEPALSAFEAALERARRAADEIDDGGADRSVAAAAETSPADGGLVQQRQPQEAELPEVVGDEPLSPPSPERAPPAETSSPEAAPASPSAQQTPAESVAARFPHRPTRDTA